MASADNEVGIFLKQQILEPAHLSVSEAARLLGVSRATMSKLVNRPGTLTAKLAARIESIFGVSAEQILKLQMQAGRDEKNENSAETFSYPFPIIKARDLTRWAETTEARMEFPVLLRRLIGTTASGVSRCAFSGYDNGQRAGWDGVVESPVGTPWVPEGCSVWELGTNQDVERKATEDFNRRSSDPLGMDSSETTYIAVTLRAWTPKRKADWQRRAKAQNCWKAVRIYDAEDLERWLERSLEARLWLSERLQRPEVSGVRTLDKAWSAWMNASEPSLGQVFFTEAVEEHRATLKTFLTDTEACHLVLSAASAEEGLAFLWSALQGESLSIYRERLLVFDSAETLQKMGVGSPTFIAVVHDLVADAVCQTLNRPVKSIFIRATAEEDDADIVLRPLSLGAIWELMQLFLTDKKPEPSSKQPMLDLLQDCGGSLTVLHRRCARFPEQRYPDWSRDIDRTEGLLAAAMIGQWDTADELQRSVLQKLTGEKKLTGFERRFKRWLKEADAPVWRCNNVCGVVSKSDIFFSLREALTPAVLNRFYDTALTVLQLPDRSEVIDFEETGWLAVSGSGGVSQTKHQLADTIAFFAVHGTVLVEGRCTYDFEQKSRELVQKVLQPMTEKTLKNVGGEISRLAEIAPETLIRLLEEDWTSIHSVIRDWLTTVSIQNGVLTHLLDAMAVTAQLSEDDFLKTCRLLSVWWTNSVVSDVRRSGIRALLRQLFTPGEVGVMTPEHLEQALRWMVKTFPDLGCLLCRRLLVPKEVVLPQGLPAPHWKRFGRRHWTAAEAGAYHNAMGEMLLSATAATTAGLLEIVPVMRALSETVLSAFHKNLVRWLRRKPSDEAIADMKEALRRQVNFRLLSENVRGMFEQFYQQLEPKEVVQKYRWLFAASDVDFAPGEIEEPDFDWDEREKMMECRRRGALQAIWTARGADGILELILYGKASEVVGQRLAALLPEDGWSALLTRCVTRPENSRLEALVRGLTTAVTAERLQTWSGWMIALPQDVGLKLLRWMPFRSAIWQWIDNTVPAWSETYWRTVCPACVYEITEQRAAVKALLAVGRPRAAFCAVQRQPATIGAKWLLRILLGMLQSSGEKACGRVEPIDEVMEILVRSQKISQDTKVYLVFRYIENLVFQGSPQSEIIRVLTLYAAEHPEFYVRLIGWAFPRDEGRRNIAECGDNALQFRGNSRTALRLIRLTETLNTEFSYERAKNWVNSVRQSCREIGRLNTADRLLGKLLVRSLYDAKTVRFPMNFYRLLTEVDSEGLFQEATAELLDDRNPPWCSFEERGEWDQWMVKRIREEMARIRYEWPRGMELLRVLERQYLAEAEEHSTAEKVLRRSNVVPW